MLSVTHNAGAGVAFALILIGTTAGISASGHKSQVGPVPARDAMISVLGAANPSPSLGGHSAEIE